MPIICRFKTTQEIVNVTQTHRRRGALIEAAVKEGIATADQLEEVTLEDAEFKQEMKDYAVTHPAPEDPKKPLIKSFVEKMIALGFTKNELKEIFTFLKDGKEI